MSYLKVEGLKLFKVDDGEDWYIIAESEHQAREYFEESGECVSLEDISEALKENETDNFRDCYSIEEIPQDDTEEIISISEDVNLIKELAELADLTAECFQIGLQELDEEELKTTALEDVPVYIKVWDMVKHDLLIDTMLGRETKIPDIVAGSVF